MIPAHLEMNRKLVPVNPFEDLSLDFFARDVQFGAGFLVPGDMVVRVEDVEIDDALIEMQVSFACQRKRRFFFFFLGQLQCWKRWFKWEW